MSILRTKALALITVQRQTAASRSTRPWMRVQHGVFGGVPITTFTGPLSLSKLAQTPSLRVSLGHRGCGAGCSEGTILLYGGGGLGTWVELTIVKKRMLRMRKKMGVDDESLEAIVGKILKALRWFLMYGY